MSVLTKIKAFVRFARRFLTQDLWTVNRNEMSKAGARLVKDIRVIQVALRTFADQKIGFQSVALAYFCMMAAVPLIAVGFALTGGFGLSDLLQKALFENLSEYPDIINIIMTGADNIIKSAQKGLFGLISALMFVWLIVWMMMRVETVFNNVWKVKKKNRKFVQSFIVDIAIMVLIPFIILIFTSGSVVYSHVLDIVIPNNLGFSDSIKSFLGWVIFGAISVLIISAMYKYIPSTYVNYRYALKAALLSGIAFTVLQYLYLETQVMVTRLNAVYGTVAFIPLFMLWLRYSWLIILYGAQFSYSFQKVAEIESELK